MIQNLFGSIDNRRLMLPLLVVACLCLQTSACYAKKKQPTQKDAVAAPQQVGMLPPLLPGTIGKDYDECMSYGNQALARQKYQMAVDNYRAAESSRPTDALSHLQLGRALLGTGAAQEDEAMAEFFNALQLKPDFLDARFSIGSLLMRKTSWDEAAGQFMQILKTNPMDAASRGDLGICYEQKGQMDSAIEQFRYIVDSQPNNTDAHYNLAVAYDLKSDFDNSAQEYKQTIRVSPKHSMAYVGLANCLINKSDFKNAVLLDEAATKIDPENYYAYISLGRAYECQGREDEALKNFRKSISLNPKAPENQRLMQNMLKEQAKKLGLQNLPGLN